MMVADSCLVLYGNSIFLAGIKAQLERDAVLERDAALDLITTETGCPDAMDLIRERRPRAVLFDLNMAEPDFAIPLLRAQPGLLLIGVDPCSDEMLILSSHAVQALSVADLVNVIRRKESNSAPFKRKEK